MSLRPPFGITRKGSPKPTIWKTSRFVEREIEIIGEALRRLADSHPDVSARVTEIAQIISFRNVLAHGYDAVVDQRVWQAVTTNVSMLLAEVEALMKEEQARK